MRNHISHWISFFIIIISFTGCSSVKVTDVEQEVTEVINGNTIKLSSGLTVDLLGIEDASSSKNFLEQYIKGKTVRLLPESSDEQQISDFDSEIRAYVETIDGIAINGEMSKEYIQWVYEDQTIIILNGGISNNDLSIVFTTKLPTFDSNTGSPLISNLVLIELCNNSISLP